jgi:uncharacterized membrane protein YkoI
MVNRSILKFLTILIAATVTASASACALFKSDEKMAREAKISMSEAITIAQRVIPGEPVQAEIGQEAGHTVYQVKILDKYNKTRWVYVDTMTGAVTEAKRSGVLD